MGTVKEGSMLCTVVDGCMYVCILGTVFILSSSCSLPHLNLGANYWALHSVKCTAVVTVRAPWAVKFVCILTMGGFFSLFLRARTHACVCVLHTASCLSSFVHLTTSHKYDDLPHRAAEITVIHFRFFFCSVRL